MSTIVPASAQSLTIPRRARTINRTVCPRLSDRGGRIERYPRHGRRGNRGRRRRGALCRIGRGHRLRPGGPGGRAARRGPLSLRHAVHPPAVARGRGRTPAARRAGPGADARRPAPAHRLRRGRRAGGAVEVRAGRRDRLRAVRAAHRLGRGTGGDRHGGGGAVARGGPRRGTGLGARALRGCPLRRGERSPGAAGGAGGGSGRAAQHGRPAGRRGRALAGAGERTRLLLRLLARCPP